MYTDLFTPESLAELKTAFVTQFPMALWETFYVTVLSTALAVVLGLPLKSLLFDESIPVDVHVTIPAHGVSVTLNGVVRAAVNSLSVPTDCIADSDIQSFVQLRQTLEQIAQTIQTTLNALQ